MGPEGLVAVSQADRNSMCKGPGVKRRATCFRILKAELRGQAEKSRKRLVGRTEPDRQSLSGDVEEFGVTVKITLRKES